MIHLHLPTTATLFVPPALSPFRLAWGSNSGVHWLFCFLSLTVLSLASLPVFPLSLFSFSPSLTPSVSKRPFAPVHHSALSPRPTVEGLSTTNPVAMLGAHAKEEQRNGLFSPFLWGLPGASVSIRSVRTWQVRCIAVPRRKARGLHVPEICNTVVSYK